MFSSPEVDRIKRAIAFECDRQHVGADRREFLWQAYQRAYAVVQQKGQLSYELVLELAGMLEPSNGGRVRITPVTFQDGGSSANPTAVPGALRTLVSFAGTVAGEVEAVEEWTRQFLWIHPFSDGNGRAGWLLYNWLLDRWRDPVKLPYFFGEAPAS